MELIVRDERESIHLSCPTGGKGVMTLVLQCRKRRVKIPDVTAAVYAAAISTLIDSGVLIVPGTPPEPVGAPALVEVTEAEITEAPTEAEAPRHYSRRSRRSEE